MLQYRLMGIYRKRLTDLVSIKIRQRVIEEGILIKARERGEEFIRKFLTDAGYNQVVFQ
ncbi:MAG: hypothetical protein AB1798_07770 [Spirochaetota bacterium]